MNAMTKVGRGRQSTYNPEIAAEICALIPSHRKGLKALLAQNDRFPAESTFYEWLVKYDDLAEMYARARKLRAQLMEEEILDISDEANGDAYVDYDKDGKPIAKIDGEAIQRSKLKVDTRKWLMAKLSPRDYGDKIDVTSGGEALPPPAPPVVIDARMQSLIAVAATRSHSGDSEPPAIEDLMG